MRDRISLTSIIEPGCTLIILSLLVQGLIHCEVAFGRNHIIHLVRSERIKLFQRVVLNWIGAASLIQHIDGIMLIRLGVIRIQECLLSG